MPIIQAEPVQMAPRKAVDMAFGAVVMGTVGILIGWFMGGSAIPVTGALGVALGLVVGWLGGRRFLISILIGTVLGGLLAWMVAGIEKISWGAGAGAAMGGFLGVQASMLLDLWAERKQAAPPEEPRP
ncbi:MAG: hypothetical protein A3A88_11005 [Nitrospirae bacterium RIFCSPLOWO2_01_FULL_62_17]|nr:MAG: hypothetical protein A3A88_11005 [Nitrospirae bacterium RIFCSPLOWO2_01_FULL_62_17]OGW90478.1 MAG: hypothetical protein A3K11_15670 [Nitrospirae bacterium RIFCSPLOWO2_12_FULL_63_8]